MSEKKKPSELKAMARQALRGSYGICAGSLFAMGAALGIACMIVQIPMALAVIFIQSAGGPAQMCLVTLGMMAFSAVVSVMEYMLFVGYSRICLTICRGEKGCFGDMFFGFKNHGGKFVCLVLLIVILPQIVNIPSMFLQIISGYTEQVSVFNVVFSLITMVIQAVIILAIMLNYGLAPLILVETPEKSLRSALAESRRLFHGNRLRQVWLGLTFIGMIFLANGSCGIGYLWVTPYITCTQIFFYFDLTRTAVAEDGGEKWTAAG